MKTGQKIKGCFFPIHAIPDTLDEFKKIFWNYEIYKDYKPNEREKEMEKDFYLLNDNINIELIEIVEPKNLKKKK